MPGTMVTVKKLPGVSAAGIADYFHDVEGQRERGDYYADKNGEAVERPGRWLGRMVASLALAGKVTVEQLVRLLDGCHPLSGGRLVPYKKDRVAAHDITFSAPKSVSVVWALGSSEVREAVEEAQANAVAEAMGYIEQNVPLVRRGDGGPVWETAAELLAVAFTHSTSRQTGQQAALGLPPDPNHHTHVLLPMARRHDGRIVAINSKALFDARQEIAAVYHTSLATRLAEAGFGIERRTGRGGRYFEVRGIPEALRTDFSSRHREIDGLRAQFIEEFRTKYGRDPDEVEQRDLSVVSRVKKGRHHPNAGFFWRAVGAAHGVTEETIDALRTARLPSPAEGRAQVAAELLAEDGLTREHAAVDTRTLRIEALQRATGVLTVAETRRTLHEMHGRGEVLSVAEDVWTTQMMLDFEKTVLAWREAREKRAPAVSASAGEAWAAIRAQQTERNVTLSGEQAGALRAMLGGRFVAVTGEAGVGKGAVLSAAAHVWRSQGRRVFAVAVAGATAQRLAADLGEGAEAMTLDGLVTRLRHGKIRLRDDDVLAVDEAGMIDTRRWAALATEVKDAGTVIAVGDEAQLSPISAGGLWPLLSKGGPRLSTIYRTALEWEREAWKDLRRGASDLALAAYAGHGRLSVTKTRAGALGAAVTAWDRDGREGLIVTDASNAERDEANRQAQERRSAAGELGSEEVRLSPTSPLFHAGDRVIFRRQWRIGGGVRRVEKGTTGTVAAVGLAGSMVTVRTNEPEPRTLTVAPGPGSSMLDLGYASHVYKAQGATVDRSYIVAGGWQTHREALYVACSRSRNGSHLFTDWESLGREADAGALAELARRGRRSQAKVAASAHALTHGRSPARKPARRVPAPVRRPLMEAYRRRRWLRACRAWTRRSRAEAAYAARWPRPVWGAEQHAASEGVPAWAVRVAGAVTGRGYGQ